MQRQDRSEVERRVTEMLELVGLVGFGGRAVTELSGGEASESPWLARWRRRPAWSCSTSR